MYTHVHTHYTHMYIHIIHTCIYMDTPCITDAENYYAKHVQVYFVLTYNAYSMNEPL